MKKATKKRSKMSAKTAWLFLAGLWSEPQWDIAYAQHYVYVSKGFRYCYGLCICLTNLAWSQKVTQATRIRMENTMDKHCPATFITAADTGGAWTERAPRSVRHSAGGWPPSNTLTTG